MSVPNYSDSSHSTLFSDSRDSGVKELFSTTGSDASQGRRISFSGNYGDTVNTEVSKIAFRSRNFMFPLEKRDAVNVWERFKEKRTYQELAANF